MEIIIGALITLVMELYKYLCDKLGKDVSTAVIYIGVFVLTMFGYTLYVYLAEVKEFPLSDYLKVFAAAVAVYEVIVKRVLYPVFAKIK